MVTDVIKKRNDIEIETKNIFLFRYQLPMPCGAKDSAKKN